MLFTTFYMLLTFCAHGIIVLNACFMSLNQGGKIHMINIPDKFHLKFVIPVEFHKKLHGPQVV